MEIHLALVALLIPVCLKNPPNDTKPATLPDNKAVVAIAALVDARIVNIDGLFFLRQNSVGLPNNTGVPYMTRGVIFGIMLRFKCSGSGFIAAVRVLVLRNPSSTTCN